jgi:luciferase family oxidoreductase group 1
VTSAAPRLSVLDLVPVREDQSTGDALAATRRLAQVADRLGFRRYWVAEHHNMPGVAATNPPVLIAMIAAATSRIRVGSGGVMLPNHVPFVVAEQFALLEAAHPGRIDLGIGRAPGTDPLTRHVLRQDRSAPGEDPVAKFAEHVDDILTVLAPDGVSLRIGHREAPLRATPAARSVPDVWLLGSSDYSARLAAERGLPYVFAHHFAGRGTAEALDLYRSTYRPSPEHPEPRTFLTVNAVVAPTYDEAQRLALPNQQAMVALRTGADLFAQRLVEDAEAVGIAPEHERLAAAMMQRWVVGDPAGAAAQVRALAATYGVDEVMIHPVAGAREGTASDTSPAREATLELLAHALSD